MRSLNPDSLNSVLLWCPELDALRISVEFVTPEFLSLTSGEHPLRIIDLDCSGDSPGRLEKFTPSLVRLPCAKPAYSLTLTRP